MDDDILTLNKLREIIDWNAFGYAVAGQAMDGETALEQIEELKPDLVILDINMPRMNGMAVVQALCKMMPDLYVLILSNYDTFEYVRSCMKQGVYDYLLKHELTETLISRKIIEIEKLRSQSKLSEKRNSYFAVVAKQQYLHDLLKEGEINQERRLLMCTQPEFASSYWFLAAVRVVNFHLFTCFGGDEEQNRLAGSIINIAVNVLSGFPNTLITHTESGSFAVLFALNTLEGRAQAISKAHMNMQLLKSNLHRFLDIEVDYAISDPHSDISSISTCYKKADALLKEPGSESCGASSSLVLEKGLMDALSRFDIDQAITIIEDVVKAYGQSIVPQLLAISKRFVQTKDIVLKDTYLRQFQNRFRARLGLNEQVSILIGHYKYLISQALEAHNPMYSMHVRTAIIYIHMHYAENISLADVADHIGICCSHLSRLFSKETGLSFIEFLTDYRIDAATILLKKPGTRIKDVCQRVGINNYNYFLRVFKKKTGLSTSEMLCDHVENQTMQEVMHHS